MIASAFFWEQCGMTRNSPTVAVDKNSSTPFLSSVRSSEISWSESSL